MQSESLSQARVNDSARNLFPGFSVTALCSSYIKLKKSRFSLSTWSNSTTHQMANKQRTHFLVYFLNPKMKALLRITNAWQIWSLRGTWPLAEWKRFWFDLKSSSACLFISAVHSYQFTFLHSIPFPLLTVTNNHPPTLNFSCKIINTYTVHSIYLQAVLFWTWGFIAGMNQSPWWNIFRNSGLRGI